MNRQAKRELIYSIVIAVLLFTVIVLESKADNTHKLVWVLFMWDVEAQEIVEAGYYADKQECEALAQINDAGENVFWCKPDWRQQ